MEQELKQLQKQEAIERLKILQKYHNLLETAVKEFEQDNTIYYSEYVNQHFQATLYWLSNNKQYERAIKDFEENKNMLVYHVILTPTYEGKVLTLLYVSNTPCEWSRDKKELIEGLPCAYVMNIDGGQCSEFGGIQIAGAMGGIVRLA